MEQPSACRPLMNDMCTPSTDPLPPPSYAEVRKKDRRHRVAKRIVVCCVVVVALAVGWCIPGPAYVKTKGNTEVTHEVYVTRTNWISPTKTVMTTITRTVPQNVYVMITSTQVQTVTRCVQPIPRPTEKPVCPYTYPAGYKDGRENSYWSPRFKSDKDYMNGYFEGFYDYTPYCISSQQLSF